MRGVTDRATAKGRAMRRGFKIMTGIVTSGKVDEFYLTSKYVRLDNVRPHVNFEFLNIM